jgi:hypothetical protein
MIPVATNQACLRVGCHSWYQSHYKCNTSRTIIFVKTIRLRVMICVYAHIRTIVVLTGGKLTEFYFPHLLSKLTIL